MWSAIVRLFGPFRAPPDSIAWAALVVAVVFALLALGSPESLTAGSRRRFLALGAAAAAFLSLGYAAIYLRGGPRIIDATTYWLQGRALSEGHVSFAIPGPAASFRGRFLVGADPDHLAGIFPPGYPLLLALGFLIDAPMVVGPLLAAGLVLATHRLAHAIARQVPGLDEAKREQAARAAALFSIACAALRYHTADTMSHGAVALFVTFALARALDARDAPKRFFGVGLLVGATLLTRLVSALPIALVAAWLAWASGARRSALVRLALGVVPGIVLLLLFQRAATGSALVPTQSAYYAASDGPPGCFRWGFGDDVGCLYEHGDFVRARLSDGYGIVAALGTTVRRLHVHLDDAFSGWPLAAVLCVQFARKAARPRALVVPAVLVLLQILAYVPFYFDGDYPGGGARFFADVLPVEHALVAVSLVTAARAIPARTIFATLAASALLFATHGVFAHRALADRDGGAPMWDEARAKDAGADRGLVFVDTDHAFDLAFDPDSAAKRKRVVARLRGDDHDRILYEALGTPQSFLYRWDDGKPALGSYIPPPPRNASGLESWRFEGESMWPPFSQRDGWAIPEWHSAGPGGCSSNGRALRLFGKGEGPASAAIEVPIPRTGSWAIIPRVVLLGDGDGDATRPSHGELTLRARAPSDAKPLTWTWIDSGEGTCLDLDAQLLEAKDGTPLDGTLTLSAGAGNASIALDRIVVERR